MITNKIFEEELSKQLKTVMGENAVWGSIRINNEKTAIISSESDKKKQMHLLVMALTNNVPQSLNIDPVEFIKELLRMAKEEKQNNQ